MSTPYVQNYLIRAVCAVCVTAIGAAFFGARPCCALFLLQTISGTAAVGPYGYGLCRDHRRGSLSRGDSGTAADYKNSVPNRGRCFCAGPGGRNTNGFQKKRAWPCQPRPLRFVYQLLVKTAALFSIIAAIPCRTARARPGDLMTRQRRGLALLACRAWPHQSDWEPVSNQLLVNTAGRFSIIAAIPSF